MKVMDAITEILKREGVSTMFSFPTTPIIESPPPQAYGPSSAARNASASTWPTAARGS
jgi:hypothetical protein